MDSNKRTGLGKCHMIRGDEHKPDAIQLLPGQEGSIKINLYGFVNKSDQVQVTGAIIQTCPRAN